MRKDRLLKLADYLETVPRRAFEISAWKERDATKPEGNTPGDCGFAGCAVGWAAHTRMFRGLRFGKGVNSDEIYYGHYSNFTAVEKLFSFDREAATYLFDSVSYPNFSATPKQVAKRIRKFVKEQA